MLQAVLYEQVVNKKLSEELGKISEARKYVKPIDKAEASKILVQYLAEAVEKALNVVAEKNKDEEKLKAQIELSNQIIALLKNSADKSSSLEIESKAEQLLAVLKENDPKLAAGKKAKDLIRPETSVAQSSLFTGALHEPQMFSELKKEIASADKIDMLVSFIKWSGLRLFIDELKEFCDHGGELRIITTSYMGATDVKAIEELQTLTNAKIF